MARFGCPPTHGLSQKPIYTVWRYARSRKDPIYPPWKDNVVAFNSWVVDNLGVYDPNKVNLHRIDTSKGYEPGNLKYVFRNEGE
jgi:hypothetical protein